MPQNKRTGIYCILEQFGLKQMRLYTIAGNEIIDTLLVVFRMFAPVITGSVASRHGGGGI
jgi:hypothetical protein